MAAAGWSWLGWRKVGITPCVKDARWPLLYPCGPATTSREVSQERGAPPNRKLARAACGASAIRALHISAWRRRCRGVPPGRAAGSRPPFDSRGPSRPNMDTRVFFSDLKTNRHRQMVGQRLTGPIKANRLAACTRWMLLYIPTTTVCCGGSEWALSGISFLEAGWGSMRTTHRAWRYDTPGLSPVTSAMKFGVRGIQSGYRSLSAGYAISPPGRRGSTHRRRSRRRVSEPRRIRPNFLVSTQNRRNIEIAEKRAVFSDYPIWQEEVRTPERASSKAGYIGGARRVRLRLISQLLSQSPCGPLPHEPKYFRGGAYMGCHRVMAPIGVSRRGVRALRFSAQRPKTCADPYLAILRIAYLAECVGIFGAAPYFLLCDRPMMFSCS